MARLVHTQMMMMVKLLSCSSAVVEKSSVFLELQGQARLE